MIYTTNKVAAQPSLLQGTSSALLRHLMWLSLTSMKSLSSGSQQNVWRNNDNDITPQSPCPSSSGGSRENRLPPQSCPRKLWPSPITLVLFECMCHYSTGDLFLGLPGTGFIPVLNHLLANGKRRDNGIIPGTTLGRLSNVSSNLLTHIWTAQWDVVPIHG